MEKVLNVAERARAEEFEAKGHKYPRKQSAPELFRKSKQRRS
jgi:hypothetical protein